MIQSMSIYGPGILISVSCGSHDRLNSSTQETTTIHGNSCTHSGLLERQPFDRKGYDNRRTQVLKDEKLKTFLVVGIPAIDVVLTELKE
jgi:hypothetical protein